MPAKTRTTSLLLTGATGAGGVTEDVLVCDGRVAARGSEARNDPGAHGAQLLDLSGFVLLAGPAEVHAHLDKAFLADRVTNGSGDLGGAITAMVTAYPQMTEADITARARRGLDAALRRGFTALRTHVDCNTLVGLTAVKALLRVRDEYHALLPVQVVALMGSPLTGAEGEPSRRLLAGAIECGVDVVGGAPSLDPHPADAIRVLVDAAAEADRPIDLHLDETTDPSVLDVVHFAEAVADRGLGGKSVASHCVSLGQQEESTARATARLLADAGIAIVTLPQTNLCLQGRGITVKKPRGLTTLEILHEAGCVVAGGSDNWRDPFNPVGRIDPLETASLLVSAGHMSVDDAYRAVAGSARRVLGITEDPLAVGEMADLLAIKASGLADAVADATEERIVMRAGRIVSRTSVQSVSEAPRSTSR